MDQKEQFISKMLKKMLFSYLCEKYGIRSSVSAQEEGLHKIRKRKKDLS